MSTILTSSVESLSYEISRLLDEFYDEVKFFDELFLEILNRVPKSEVPDYESMDDEGKEKFRDEFRIRYNDLSIRYSRWAIEQPDFSVLPLTSIHKRYEDVLRNIAAHDALVNRHRNRSTPIVPSPVDASPVDSLDTATSSSVPISLPDLPSSDMFKSVKDKVASFIDEIASGIDTNSSKLFLKMINFGNESDLESNIKSNFKDFISTLTLERDEAKSFVLVLVVWLVIWLSNASGDELISNKAFMINILKKDRLLNYTSEEMMAVLTVLGMVEIPKDLTSSLASATPDTVKGEDTTEGTDL